MNHLQAKQIVDLALPTLSEPEKLVVRGISDLETSYGQWGLDPLVFTQDGSTNFQYSVTGITTPGALSYNLCVSIEPS